MVIIWSCSTAVFVLDDVPESQILYWKHCKNFITPTAYMVSRHQNFYSCHQNWGNETKEPLGDSQCGSLPPPPPPLYVKLYNQVVSWSISTTIAVCVMRLSGSSSVCRPTNLWVPSTQLCSIFMIYWIKLTNYQNAPPRWSPLSRPRSPLCEIFFGPKKVCRLDGYPRLRRGRKKSLQTYFGSTPFWGHF